MPSLALSIRAGKSCVVWGPKSLLPDIIAVRTKCFDPARSPVFHVVLGVGQRLLPSPCNDQVMLLPSDAQLMTSSSTELTARSVSWRLSAQEMEPTMDPSECSIVLVISTFGNKAHK